jgi:hypothetical protein
MALDQRRTELYHLHLGHNGKKSGKAILSATSAAGTCCLQPDGGGQIDDVER